MTQKLKKASLKFLLDENVDVRIASFLQEKGFSTLICPKGLKNGDVIALAVKEGCVLLTNDTDFTHPRYSENKDFPGIIVFRIHPPDREKLCKALDKLLSKATEKELAGKAHFLEEVR